MSKKATLKEYINRHYEINSLCELFFDNCRDGKSVFHDLWIELNDNIINEVNMITNDTFKYLDHLEFNLYDPNLQENLILNLWHNGISIEYLNSDNTIDCYDYE